MSVVTSRHYLKPRMTTLVNCMVLFN